MHRIQQLAQAKPYAVMLREKDLDVQAYERLAGKVKAICDGYGVLLILHQQGIVAEKMKHSYLHLSMPALRACKAGEPPLFVGASVHSVAEAKEAQALGAAYIVAGHIYDTDCKPGIPPKGLAWLRQVCQAVTLPVFAIGGIARENAAEVLASGAKGFCVMSEAMTCKDPAALVQDFAKVKLS